MPRFLSTDPKLQITYNGDIVNEYTPDATWEPNMKQYCPNQWAFAEEDGWVYYMVHAILEVVGYEERMTHFQNYHPSPPPGEEDKYDSLKVVLRKIFHDVEPSQINYLRRYLAERRIGGDECYFFAMPWWFGRQFHQVAYYPQTMDLKTEHGQKTYELFKRYNPILIEESEIEDRSTMKESWCGQLLNDVINMLESADMQRHWSMFENIYSKSRLTEVHDELALLYNESRETRSAAERGLMFKRHDWHLADYSDEIGTITFLPNLEALIGESRVMHHCVSSYADTCHRGHSAIYAVRLKGAEEGKFREKATLEMGKARTRKQFRGITNAAPSDEITRWVDKWIASSEFYVEPSVTTESSNA